MIPGHDTNQKQYRVRGYRGGGEEGARDESEITAEGWPDEN